MGRFPLPNWGCAGEGATFPLPGKKCKLPVAKVKFGVYFASYEVAQKVNEHRLVDGVRRPYGSATGRLCPHGSIYDHDFFTIW